MPVSQAIRPNARRIDDAPRLNFERLIAYAIAERRPADRAARIAKFWAAEAGARVAATSQHVHGGIGIDITYPLHRYFLWAKQNELTLGSASQQLAHLGSTYPEGRL